MLMESTGGVKKTSNCISVKTSGQKGEWVTRGRKSGG